MLGIRTADVAAHQQRAEHRRRKERRGEARVELPSRRAYGPALLLLGFPSANEFFSRSAGITIHANGELDAKALRIVRDSRVKNAPATPRRTPGGIVNDYGGLI